MQMLFRVFSFLVLLSFGMVAAAPLAEQLILYPFDDAHVDPEQAGLPTVTEHVVATADGTLIVWTAPPTPGQPVIFYLHGNAGNLALRTGRFQRFLARGYGLVALAYPGSSGSTGTRSQDSLLSAATLIWLQKDSLLPLSHVSSQSSQTVIYGESLGAAVAIHLNASAAFDSLKGVGPAAGMILEAPFTSIAALAKAHYPHIPKLPDVLAGKWDSVGWAKQLRAPLFILHGTEDSLIPIEMGRQIFAVAPTDQKNFLPVLGASHTDLWRSDTLPQLFAFIDQFSLR